MGEHPSAAIRSGMGLLLGALALVLPFEPRHPIVEAGGLRLTALEAIVALLGSLLLVAALSARPTFVRRPSLPVLALGLYAAAHLLSAAMATVHRTLAAKFAVRMVVMAGFAALVGLLPARAHRTGLRALALVAGLLALLAIAEVGGVRALDPFLDLFRDSPFNVGGARRATAGSEYPNLAAAFLMCGLLAGVAEVAEARASARTLAFCSVAWATLISLGLLATYSRGALVAAALGLGALCLALAARRRERVPVPFLALLVLVALAAGLTASGEAFRLRLGTEGAHVWYGARYAPKEDHFILRPAETRVTGVRVTNTGRKAWARSEAFHLSYHWFDPAGRSLMDGGRTQLPRDIAPGESVDLEAEVRAPALAGAYRLVWDMVHERTTWFSAQGVAPKVVPVEVRSVSAEPAPSPSDLPASGPPEVWRPGRGELWRLAFGMWRDHPWTGVGSDNFRRLYGPRAGHASWDARVFANNTLLEAAATTGTFGVLALGLALVAAPLAAWRGRGGPRPALFALGVGLAAHGLVDYTLAFTGHYLLFAIVIGAAAGLDREAPPIEETPMSAGVRESASNPRTDKGEIA